jgi:glycerol-3-phosphate acyltransferase PlsY
MSGIFIFLATLAYLLGSIPFGKLAGIRHGLDIQKHGSGNIGFANVLRTLGWRPSLVVLAGDIIKGFIQVLIAQHYLTLHQSMVVGIVAMLGHIFPVWLKFKGGKGIATGLGVTLALSPLVGLAGIIVYIIALSIFRKSAPSSVAAAWSLPLFCLLISPGLTGYFIGLAVIATWTHRTNLKKLKKPAHAS